MKRLLMWCWYTADRRLDAVIREVYLVNLPSGRKPFGSAKSRILYAAALITSKMRNLAVWAIYLKLGIVVSTEEYLCYMMEKRK